VIEEEFWNHSPLLNHFRIDGASHSFFSPTTYAKVIGGTFQSQFYMDMNDRMFETYGDELNFVEDHDPSNIWTLIEENGVLSISSGKHMVNRVGYFVTEIPCHENINIVLD
tara:strand:+ start:121 stop:453 length:333 start_codon:yes stop_codon:yes gene_type:complete